MGCRLRQPGSRPIELRVQCTYKLIKNSLSGGKNNEEKRADDREESGSSEHHVPAVGIRGAQVGRLQDAASGGDAHNACQGARRVGHAHHNTGVLGGDVQMVHCEAGPGESAGAQRHGRADDCAGCGLQRGHENERHGSGGASDGVEQLPSVGDGADAGADEVVGHNAADVREDEHDEVWEHLGEAHVVQAHVEALLEVRREPIHEHIERVVECEIVHHDGPHWQAEEDPLPWNAASGLLLLRLAPRFARFVCDLHGVVQHF